VGQEVSVSYQAVKSKVYKLIDALVEDTKTEAEVKECVQRWWRLVHPSDRAIAVKYLSMVLAKSGSSLAAISDAMIECQEAANLRQMTRDRVFREILGEQQPESSTLRVPLFHR
jgi:hypothetical protein